MLVPVSGRLGADPGEDGPAYGPFWYLSCARRSGRRCMARRLFSRPIGCAGWRRARRSIYTRSAQPSTSCWPVGHPTWAMAMSSRGCSSAKQPRSNSSSRTCRPLWLPWCGGRWQPPPTPGSPTPTRCSRRSPTPVRRPDEARRASVPSRVRWRVPGAPPSYHTCVLSAAGGVTGSGRLHLKGGQVCGGVPVPPGWWRDRRRRGRR